MMFKDAVLIDLNTYLNKRQCQLKTEIENIPRNTDDDDEFFHRVNLCGRLQEINELLSYISTL